MDVNCKMFRMIIGKDFRLTRKATCKDVLGWLPRNQKANFRMAKHVNGFHPKAIFLLDATGDAFALVGSSNLSDAAPRKNCEANMFSPLPAEDRNAASIR